VNAAETAMILGTPVGSRVLRKGSIGDTGVRAEALAQRLGIVVVAYQDLGPTTSYPGMRAARLHLHTPDDLNPKDNLAELADEHAQDLTTILHGEGAEHIIVRSHSGAGPFGTQLARALPKIKDGVDVSHVGTSDIVGLKRMTFWQGYRQVRAHDKVAKATPQDHRTPPGHPGNTLWDYLSDVGVRGRTLYIGDVAFQNLVAIGNEQPGTTVLAHVPAHSIYGTEAEGIYREIEMAVNRPEGAAPFVVRRGLGDYHSSMYDHPDLGADFVRDLWNLAQPSS
jgi:hypothetical protein